MQRMPLVIFLLAILALVATGCDPLSRNNFEMLELDVTRESQARLILGEPTATRESRWHYQRPEKTLDVILDFDDDGILQRKQWVNSTAGVWVDLHGEE